MSVTTQKMQKTILISIKKEKKVFSPETIDFCHERGNLKSSLQAAGPQLSAACVEVAACRFEKWLKAFLFICYKSNKSSAAHLIWSRYTSVAGHWANILHAKRFYLQIILNKKPQPALTVRSQSNKAALYTKWSKIMKENLKNFCGLYLGFFF